MILKRRRVLQFYKSVQLCERSSIISVVSKHGQSREWVKEFERKSSWAVKLGGPSLLPTWSQGHSTSSLITVIRSGKHLGVDLPCILSMSSVLFKSKQ
ncbi:hypothetical protein M378DRAFT_634188 [Amanita muscaria Koide BX008]|uniref:Uncharacterized protein n=1 Tax=Amanita muscaria (strain Koide BX008) TaxID=946122 RepID=A0A0C2SN38_AMAMK|nr:hypothetical protein M378DRAFT_634188 [Amanita muscaria Koide BX008]